MPANRKKHLRKSGFTLVEILIVTCLAGFLFFMMFGSYSSIQNLLKEQGRSSQKSNQALYVLSMLTSDLNNLYFENWSLKSFFIGEKVTVSQGFRIDSLRFISKSQYANASTMQTKSFKVQYFGQYDEEANKAYLFRTEDIFVTQDEDTSGFPIPVLEDVIHLEFKYSRDNRNWREDWNSKIHQGAPSFIQAELRWMEGEVERSEKITVQPYSLYR